MCRAERRLYFTYSFLLCELLIFSWKPAGGRFEGSFMGGKIGIFDVIQVSPCSRAALAGWVCRAE